MLLLTSPAADNYMAVKDRESKPEAWHSYWTGFCNLPGRSTLAGEDSGVDFKWYQWKAQKTLSHWPQNGNRNETVLSTSLTGKCRPKSKQKSVGKKKVGKKITIMR